MFVPLRGNLSNSDKLPNWATLPAPLDEDESDDFLLSDSSSESLDEEDDLSDDEDELLDEEESDESFVLPCSLGCMVMVS